MPRARRANRWLYFLPWLLLVPFAVGLTMLEFRLKRRGGGIDQGKPEIVWIFEAREPGAIISSPWLEGDRVYIGAIHDRGLAPGGAVHALNAGTGKEVWRFDDDGAMLHMYSSPTVSAGRLYIGEGMHANFESKLTCVDAASGKKHWRFGAAGHIESTPCVADGRVFFGAGDDGVFALDAESGMKLWQFNESLHVDSSPAIADGKVFVGSGVSRRYRATEVLALDATSGRPAWRVRVELPGWGSPVVDAGQVFVGLGNGRLDKSDPKPAGALLCLNAATGKRMWQYPLPDGVLARAAVDAERVYFGCRDGSVYALTRFEGRLVWKSDLGSPVVAAPALLDGRLYGVASAGRVVCLDAHAGTEIAAFDVAAHARAECRLYSSPALRAEAAGTHRLVVGAEVRFPTGNAAIVYCLRF